MPRDPRWDTEALVELLERMPVGFRLEQQH